MQKSYRYREPGDYHYQPNQPTPPQNKSGWEEWIWIVILFLVPTGITQCIAVVLLLGKIRRVRIQRRETKGPEQTMGQVSQDSGSGAAVWKEQLIGSLKMIVGGAMALVFLFFAAADVAVMVQTMFLGRMYLRELSLLLICLFMCGVGAAVCWSGWETRGRWERWANYMAYIGVNRQVSIGAMAGAMDVSERRLIGDLRKMLAAHVLPTGYLDMRTGMLVLTDTGCADPEPQPEPEAKEWTQDEQILREIGLINDLISDPELNVKIERIQEITRKIFQYQKNNPQRTEYLRTFLNYYLPTTLKILRSYARLDAQGVEGENISATKERIEGMMDQVVEGFEKQLDRLFRSDAMDLAADVQVLENMLKKDGLSGDEMNYTRG